MLNERSREIFKHIVENYLQSGEPVASRHLSQLLAFPLSSASVRNVMQHLEELGLVYAPHTSAGRLPTHLGLRFFVDSLLEIDDLPKDERVQIETELSTAGQQRTLEGILEETSRFLSALTHSAGVVITSKEHGRLKHIEFVRLDSERALAVLVQENGDVENRIFSIPLGLPASALNEASNYLNARLRNHTLSEICAEIKAAQIVDQQEVDQLVNELIGAGLASWGGMEPLTQLIVRGQAHLLEDLKAQEDLERVRSLLADLERKKDIVDLLQNAEEGEGVRIFIGAENKLFSLSGSSTIIAPLFRGDKNILGAIGVIGPTRLNYGRIIPLVAYTAEVLSKLLHIP